MAANEPWTAISNGIRLRVRIVPRSSREGVDGLVATADGPAVAARVRAVPEDGKANAALAAVIAEWLGMPRSAVTLVAGARSRVKSLVLAGDPTATAARLRAACAAFPSSQREDASR